MSLRVVPYKREVWYINTAVNRVPLKRQVGDWYHQNRYVILRSIIKKWKYTPAVRSKMLYIIFTTGICGTTNNTNNVVMQQVLKTITAGAFHPFWWCDTRYEYRYIICLWMTQLLRTSLFTAMCVCVCVLHIKPFFYSSTSSTPSVRTDSSP